MIERIQLGTKGAAKAMMLGQTKARQTLQQFEKTDQTLLEINQAVARIREMNTQIATAADEQGAVAEEINRNLLAINDLSAHSAQGAEQTAASSAKQALLATELQSMAGKFKI